MFEPGGGDVLDVRDSENGPQAADRDRCSIKAMARSPDGGTLVVGGQHILKLLQLPRGGGRPEWVNVRSGKHSSQHHAAQDVKWHPLGKHLVASASPTGSVVLWHLSRLQGWGGARTASTATQEPPMSDSSKLAEVLKGHKGACTRVCWHPKEPEQLLSCSADHTVKLWDLRAQQRSAKGEMRSAVDFKCASKVRDAQFNPRYPTKFLAALESGQIGVWDVRSTSRPERTLGAHNFVLAVEWHDSDANRFASSGRDGLIQLWNLRKVEGRDNNRPTTSIRNVVAGASVSRVQWRPGCDFAPASEQPALGFRVFASAQLHPPFMPSPTR